MSTARCWSAQEFEGDTDPWRFCIVDPRCSCGWYLANAEPVMGRTGVERVEGDYKRHGHVAAASWDIYDQADAA